MDCTEAYREHIMYSFNGFCKVVIRFAALENGYINIDTEDSIKQQLITALFQFRFD